MTIKSIQTKSFPAINWVDGKQVEGTTMFSPGGESFLITLNNDYQLSLQRVDGQWYDPDWDLSAKDINVVIAKSLHYDQSYALWSEQQINMMDY